MTRILNEEREKVGLATIKEEWIRVMCRESKERQEKGLTFLPVQTLITDKDRKVFYVKEKDFRRLIPELIEGAQQQGRPKKKRHDHHRKLSRQHQGANARTELMVTAINAIMGDAQRQANEAFIKRTQKPLSIEDWVKVVNSMQTCPACGGKGCGECVNGYLPNGHPRYVGTPRLVHLRDIVYCETTEYPAWRNGVVIAWTIDGKETEVVLLDEKSRPTSVIVTVETDTLQLIARTRKVT